jgi:molecular chaperone GrpE
LRINGMNGRPDDFETADRVVAPEAASELETLRAALAEAEARAAEARDVQLRALAEVDNIRKRAARDVEAAQRFGVERFAADVIEVCDSLELGLAASAGAAADAHVEGMQATLRLLYRAFERAGILAIDPQGEPFNPELHEAMTTQVSADQAAGTVLAVVQKGYALNGRLLRPARVVIARAPATA